MHRYLLILPALVFLPGCPVLQPQNTPVWQQRLREPVTGNRFWFYKPSNYNENRRWPLVIPLHGTHGWDSSMTQVMAWKHLAEQKGFLVAAPQLSSVQGILPVVRWLWFEDLERDERRILALIDHMVETYNADPKAVMLTGFSAGGYPLYWTGLRNPGRFSMLIACACNSDMDIFDRVEMTDRVRKLPIAIIWGKDDLKPIQDQSWDAWSFLRRNRCFDFTQRKEVGGAHRRQPPLCYGLWLPYLPQKYRK